MSVPLYVTRDNAEVILGIPANMIDTLIESQMLCYSYVCGRVIVKASDIVSLIESNMAYPIKCQIDPAISDHKID